MDDTPTNPPEAFTATPETAIDHHIEAQSSLVEQALRTLKHGDAFLITNTSGDICNASLSPQGLFYRDTRYLSTFELLVGSRKPLLLSSVIEDDNASLSINLTNPDLHGKDGIVLPRDVFAIERTKLLWQGACHERIGLHNYDSQPRELQIVVLFESDFRDLFEVRGERRKARGTLSTHVASPDCVEIRYDGLDGLSRYTSIVFEPKPQRLDGSSATFNLSLKAGEKISILATVTCSEDAPKRSTAFGSALIKARRELRQTSQNITTVESSNTLFNEIACRSMSDIYMLISRTKNGHLYPYAGIPWFSTVFGRDGIITAMMLLWIDPNIARGVIGYLAETQATASNPATDAQPGKIMHEQRFGEMARLGEVPFAHYYGTVDATPLFVMLAGLYYRRTGDRATIASIWPNIVAALEWCDTYGDRDGDGFVEYQRETEAGLANQGWKDSQDSIFHADGEAAVGPIALCEVQGYVYAAKQMASELALILGHEDKAAKWSGAAERLRTRFHAAFWCEDIGTYALALDGRKQPCRVRSSNAGHALFTGIADPSVARQVADTLTNADSFSGWGIRTIARSEARYNPMSYHNGSIWPHDNALIAMGFGRYGLKDHAAKVFAAMFDAASYQDLRRLPELFCGFIRRPKRGPTAYPVACSPQAWAAASPMAFLSACLGLELRHDANEVCFVNPQLPRFLDDLIIRGLRLGSSRIDVHLRRQGHDVTVSMTAREGTARLLQER